MYATIRIYDGFKTDLLEDGLRALQEEFSSILQGIPSFLDYGVLDGDDGTLVAYGIFGDRAGALECDDRAVGWLAGTMAPMLTAPPLVLAGEVVAAASGSGSGALYANIRIYEAVRREYYGDVVSAANYEIAPALAAQPGFAGYYVVDCGERATITISLFQTARAADASAATAAGLVGALLSHAVTAPPRVLAGELRVRSARAPLAPLAS